MRILLIVILSASCFLRLHSQYFQQQVDYKIEVTLDDSLHQLNGNLELLYTNNSPDELQEIYFHLWPNAFKNRETAFAKQKLRDGDTDFYFADDDTFGSIDSLAFKVDGKIVSFNYDPKHIDIATIQLNTPLASGQQITISTPFRVKIPESYSRLGHVGQTYQMTQWYPKPAVYDQDGWHPMPYLDRGEFYSEFGSFEVRITLPKDYVVGATGVLQTPLEKEFLANKVKETDLYLLDFDKWEQQYGQPSPQLTDELKTIVYKAEKVHDFAWFADKTFKVQKSEVQLGEQTIDTWVMFTNFEESLWREAINYVNRSVQFYSELVGEYPYPQATAVQSALSAGAGMEYPMITVIGPSYSEELLDEVITHEVGHNWFYGILASNERDHAWMDEGINSYYERRYMEQYYESTNLEGLPWFLIGDEDTQEWEVLYQYLKRNNVELAINTHSDSLTLLGYYFGAYDKPAELLIYLEAFLDTEQFDRAMQAYFQEWQFKHPQPKNFQGVLEKNTGKNLAWLFEGLINSNQILDYSITDIEEDGDFWKLKVANLGQIEGPLMLVGLNSENFILEKWYDGFSGEKVLTFPKGEYDRISIDPYHFMPEFNRQNNHIRTTGAFKKLETVSLGLFPKLDDNQKTNLYFHPVVGSNVYDGWMFGLGMHNLAFPTKPFQFILSPFYASKSESFGGVGKIEYHWLPSTSIFRKIKLGVELKRFHFDERNLENASYDLKYDRLMPYLKLDFNKNSMTRFQHYLQWRTLFLNVESANFEDGIYAGNETNTNTIHELSYQAVNKRSLNPFKLNFALEGQAYEDFFGRDEHYLKASIAYHGNFTFADQKHFQYRLFVGTFLSNSQRNGARIFPGGFNLSGQGYNDYRFDELFFGRNEIQGLWSQQISIQDGGMKLPLGPSFNLGRSNSFAFALNLKTDLPEDFLLDLPIKPYLDIGYFDNALPTGANDTFTDQLLWSGGLELEIIKDFASIYFPLANSKNVNNILKERGNYFSRVSFRLALHKINLLELNEIEWF